MSFEKNIDLEILLQKINGLLKPIEIEQRKNFSGKNTMPTILQIGAPRSGSTLFTQWSSSLNIFSNPSNFLSRFYAAPYIGALIYEMIVNPKFDYQNEFSDINSKLEYESNIGKTVGFKAPHEFWYFWRQHFSFSQNPVSNDTFMKTANFDSFNVELEMIQNVFDKSFVIKAHIMNWYLESFSKNINNGLYVHINRGPVANIRSLLKARLKWKDSFETWFSFKPREFDSIENMDFYHQVAGQIYFIEKEILDNKHFLKDRYLNFSYEELCLNPDQVYGQLVEKYNQFSERKISSDYKGVQSFRIRNSEDNLLSDKKIEKAFDFFIKEFGDLEYN